MNAPSKRRPSRPVAPDDLERLALDYLGRYASSVGNLRRVLARKVERSARLHGTDRAAGLAAVERLVARLADAGIVDDRSFAEGRASSLFRRGGSRRAIARKLAAKGVHETEIDGALRSLRDLAADPELAAAAAYARRRRLGPFRAAELRDGWRNKDMAALARAGFGPETARRVVEAPSAESLVAEAEEG